mmetsp:Transcript_54944/g.156383  ORF Transcript_54944/g.156383 Transcript_54944/m.156383 type:complete len:126 (-) Transcript_54944:283-660(-)
MFKQRPSPNRRQKCHRAAQRQPQDNAEEEEGRKRGQEEKLRGNNGGSTIAPKGPPQSCTPLSTLWGHLLKSQARVCGVIKVLLHNVCSRDRTPVKTYKTNPSCTALHKDIPPRPGMRSEKLGSSL